MLIFSIRLTLSNDTCRRKNVQYAKDLTFTKPKIQTGAQLFKTLLHARIHHTKSLNESWKVRYVYSPTHTRMYFLKRKAISIFIVASKGKLFALGEGNSAPNMRTLPALWQSMLELNLQVKSSPKRGKLIRSNPGSDSSCGAVEAIKIVPGFILFN